MYNCPPPSYMLSFIGSHKIRFQLPAADTPLSAHLLAGNLAGLEAAQDRASADPENGPRFFHRHDIVGQNLKFGG